MAVLVAPITDSAVSAVAVFLHENLNARVPARAWASALHVPWAGEPPNHGFVLRDDSLAGTGADGLGGQVVGAYLAFYCEREIDGRRERFCNLGAWCVLPAYRFHGIRLLKALLAQDGYTFTDLSPSGTVVPLNQRLKFEFLDTATALVPNLPWPVWRSRRRGAVISDPSAIEAALGGALLQVYRDHAQTAAARHVLLQRGDDQCYVMFRKDRRKNLPLFATILHVSNPELFADMVRPLAGHLLLRHGALATLVELRVVGARPAMSIGVPNGRRKMFRSSHLRPEQIDYLYSELACVAW